MKSRVRSRAKHRTEVIGDCTLHLGDCREILPTLGKVDAVVTDPPYGIRADESPIRGRAKHYHRVNNFDRSRPGVEVFDMIRRISSEQIIWGGNYFADMLPPSMRWLVWDKMQGDFSLADCEFAWCSDQGAARIIRLSRGRANQDGRVHPTQKPIDLMIRSLDFVPDAEVVLDPFMGGGSTGMACLMVAPRRKFIGIEIEEQYFDAACRRIDDAYRGGDFLK